MVNPSLPTGKSAEAEWPTAGEPPISRKFSAVTGVTAGSVPVQLYIDMLSILPFALVSVSVMW